MKKLLKLYRMFYRLLRLKETEIAEIKRHAEFMADYRVKHFRYAYDTIFSDYKKYKDLAVTYGCKSATELEETLESLCKCFQPKQTDNKKESTELLKPRIMENGCEYYLAGEVRLCIEQAARQIAESNSVYKELDSIIDHQKFKRCIAIAKYCRLRARWFGDNAFYKKEQWALQWHRRWLKIAEKFKTNSTAQYGKGK